MADEATSSTNNSLSETNEKKEESVTSTYTSSFSAQVQNDNSVVVSSPVHTVTSNPVSGMISHSRLPYNPFAVKNATPTRSVTDSTENKESRPVLAPPTLKLGSSDSSSAPWATSTKIVLRPSSLAAQTEKLKTVNSNNTSKEADPGMSDIFKDSCVEASGKDENNLKSNVFASGKSTSLPESIATSTTIAENTTFGSPEEKSTNGGAFIFGQNLHERASNYDSGQVPSSSLENNSHKMTFEAAAVNEDSEEKRPVEQTEMFKKSLSESAKEYESKQVKRKYDEVIVFTGEEDESNVLQMNCKLFAFDKTTMSWLERSRGILRLNDKKQDGVLHSRILMRTQGSLRVVLNANVWPGMTIEHPSAKTVRLTAIDSEGVKVYLVMANPKDATQLFNALDWRVAMLKSNEDADGKITEKVKIDDDTCSSCFIDVSSNDSFTDSPRKRCRTDDHESDSGTDGFRDKTDGLSSDSLADSSEK